MRFPWWKRLKHTFHVEFDGHEFDMEYKSPDTLVFSYIDVFYKALAMLEREGVATSDDIDKIRVNGFTKLEMCMKMGEAIENAGR